MREMLLRVLVLVLLPITVLHMMLLRLLMLVPVPIVVRVGATWITTQDRAPIREHLFLLVLPWVVGELKASTRAPRASGVPDPKPSRRVA